MSNPGEIEIYRASGGKVTDTAQMRGEFFDILREAERRRAKTDLFYLSRMVLGAHYFNGGMDRMDFHHEGLAGDLMQCWNKRLDHSVTRYVCRWPRNTMKSTVCTEDFAVWVLLNYPEARILIDSELVMNSYRFLAAIKAKFESEYFQYLFGQLYDPMDRWNTETLKVKRRMEFKEPSIDVGGIDTEKTSMHYDLIIADDLQGKTNSNTRDQIEKVIKHAKGYGSLLNPGGMILYPMTRWAHGDLGSWQDEQNQAAHKAGAKAPYIVNELSCFKRSPEGKLLTAQPEFPRSLNLEKLAEERSVQGPFLFSCNYLLNPTSEETSTFKAHWVKDYYHDKSLSDFPEPRRVYITVDQAGEGKYEDADYTAICVALIDQRGEIWVLDMIRGHFTVKETADRLFHLCELYHPKTVGIETVFAQKELFFYLKDQAKLEGRRMPVQELKTSNKTKLSRIMGLQPGFETGKIHIKKSMTFLEDELLRHPKGQHDDCIDALAYILEFAEIPFATRPVEFWERNGWGLNDKGVKMTGEEFKKMHGIAKPDRGTLKFWAWDKAQGKRKVIYKPTSRLLR